MSHHIWAVPPQVLYLYCISRWDIQLDTNWLDCYINFNRNTRWQHLKCHFQTLAVYKIRNKSSIAANHPASLMAQGRGRQPRQQSGPPRTACHRPAPGNFCEDSSSGEEFNFTPMDEHTPDGDVLDAPQPVSPMSVEPVDGSATSTRPATPSEQASESSWSRTAPDIDFFFERGSKVPPVTRTLCKYVAFHNYVCCTDKDCCLGWMG